MVIFLNIWLTESQNLMEHKVLNIATTNISSILPSIWDISDSGAIIGILRSIDLSKQLQIMCVQLSLLNTEYYIEDWLCGGKTNRFHICHHETKGILF